MIQIYTDGACSGNPGPGGWACLVVRDGKEIAACGNEAHTTNNRMELTAVIQGIDMLTDNEEATLYCDSQYVVKGINEWMAGWKKKKWLTSTKKLVANSDLWKELDIMLANHKVVCYWVPRNSTEGMEYVDRVSKEQREEVI